MATKLDQALDDIIGESKHARGRGRGRRVPNATRGAKAPTGGVQKHVATKVNKATPKVTPTGPTIGRGDVKVQVSNLPVDIDEAQIKEFFQQSIGPIKKVILAYGPEGRSRGIATILFAKPGSAQLAVDKCNGMVVDKTRKMKVEIIIDPSRAAAVSLSDRLTQPKNQKNQPKSAAPAEKKTNADATRGNGATRGRGTTKRGRNAGRPKRKTAEELDAEMTDYFDSNAATNANGAAVAPATNGAATNGGDEMDAIS
ncbi:MAG: hypothetical protein MMC33_001784 [Icmadophila ericetorum]|nr:hypothetical protein [Icmadophila ericetorum]